jgi:hypothetical protein
MPYALSPRTIILAGLLAVGTASADAAPDAGRQAAAAAPVHAITRTEDHVVVGKRLQAPASFPSDPWIGPDGLLSNGITANVGAYG